jgi:hypothetical protein
MHMTKPIRLRPARGYLYAPGKLQTLEEAAHALNTDRVRLQRECERKAERCDDTAVAHLEDGVVAIRCAGDWKFRFPLGAATPSSEGA